MVQWLINYFTPASTKAARARTAIIKLGILNDLKKSGKKLSKQDQKDFNMMRDHAIDQIADGAEHLF